ncbi:MAG: hypothetical protein IJJ71_01120 [Treponema sp.]|uniref:hypothetical protein n=1 Tax=Treponema sp. TaxID=166 RepID=UPI0025DAA7CC|nr:hypothetical protein [Treponema sp.]MBQ9908522.1 hypothetical protein [Treponema sp.]MBR0494760.1 hypothetical protein [Treponema sp.]
MKSYAFIFFAAILSIFISCEKSALTEDSEVVEPIPVETFVEGKILAKKGELCLYGRDFEMHPVIKLSAGAEISVLEIDGVIDEKFIPEKGEVGLERTNDSSDSAENADKNAQTSQKGIEYVHVVHENMDFWLDKSVFALNCENAVAIEKAFLYSDAALTEKMSSPQSPLKFASLIAVSKSQGENPSENQNAIKVFFYDSAENSVRQAFVSSASISTKIDDIVVSQIAEELKVTKRAVPRNELFARAAKYKPCQKVLAALNAQKTETQTNSYQEVLKSMQRMSFGVNVDELLTVDQSKDPFK